MKKVCDCAWPQNFDSYIELIIRRKIFFKQKTCVGLQCCYSVQYLTVRAVPAGIAGTWSIRHTLGHTAVRTLSITHVPRGTATDHTLYTCKVNTTPRYICYFCIIKFLSRNQFIFSIETLIKSQTWRFLACSQ